MALATRPKPPVHHKKRTGKHHRVSKHYTKAYWPYLPIGFVVGLALVVNALLGSPGNVLGAQTDFSPSLLLQLTNQARADNGESGLGLNGLLDSAAQAKANDMVTRDYWSHDTPTGQTPWSFIDATGYIYLAAGENLAYGFSSSQDTLTGWMNSPEHRANILNTDYQEVGFGIAESSNYQGQGPETVIVAMYAKPRIVATPVATAAPAASAPAPTATTTNTSPATTDTPPSAAPTPTPATNQPATKTNTQAHTQTAQLRSVPRLQLVSKQSAAASSLLSLAALLALALVVFRHGLAWHRWLRKSEAFVIKNPWFDVAAVTLGAICFIAIQSVGYIG